MRVSKALAGTFIAVSVASLSGRARAQEAENMSQNMSLWPIESPELQMSLPHPLVCSEPPRVTSPLPPKPKARKPARLPNA